MKFIKRIVSNQLEFSHYNLFLSIKGIFAMVGQTVTTVKEELEHNRRLTRPKEEFVKIMNDLNLPYPKQIGKPFLALTSLKM